MKKIINLFIIAALLVSSACMQQDKKELHLDYEKYTLANGLEVILHVDKSDPIVSLAILFHVGSNREVTGRTGFAHLFEHMMFQQSENVGEDQFFKYIQNAGGTLNGGTWNDGTIYFEVVPKNALEMILWMEADRMGYMINTVTQKSFAIQQNVVQNEKRQVIDNRPYGHTRSVISKNLYPEGHPYSWTVIGEMEDIRNATVKDVKEFHAKWYVPNNATIVLAGDFETEEAKQLIEKYFGEIKKGEDIQDPEPWHITLEKTKKVYHEDNFARAAQLRMLWPTVEQFSDDSYPLNFLSELFSRGKKAPLYKIIEKEKQQSSNYYAYNGDQEITGAFNITVTANEGINLEDIENSVFEAFTKFEEEGFTEDDIERIKASLETDFYNNISSILYKAFQLAEYNEYTGSPEFYKTDIEKIKAVTKDDILRVYNKYIKDKPYLATSFVPKGQIEMIAKGSVKAEIVEEDIMNATQVAIEDIEEEKIEKTPSSFDRSVQPEFGPDPLLSIPEIWDDKLANGLRVYGIEHNELPLVEFNIILKGGHYLDKLEQAGAANLVAKLMMEGTKNKTPLELEEEIEKLGAEIWTDAYDSEISINVNTLARNYDQTIALVQEILLEPRWDEEEFELLKTKTENQLLRQKADPNYLAGNAFYELVYGKNHILGIDTRGTQETVSSITIDDLKAYYQANFSPSIASFHITGNISKNKVVASLQDLAAKWEAKEVVFPEYEIPAAPKKSQIYFVDVPGAKQSVINIGGPALSRTDDDYYPAHVMNYSLGGSFNGKVNIVLREEKGYTYGARTRFSGSYLPGTFKASSSVRSTATLESVQIFKDLMEKHRAGVSDEDLEFTKNALIKSNARAFETLRALIGMLEKVSMYDLPKDFVKTQETIVREMTSERHIELAQKYIDPAKMYFVIAGDAKTQFKELKKVGIGDPILY